MRRVAASLLLSDGKFQVWPRPLVTGLDEALAVAARLGFGPGQTDFLRVNQGVAQFVVGRRPLPEGYSWVPLSPSAFELCDLKSYLFENARFVGFPLVGATAPTLPTRYTQRFADWLAAGDHAGLDFLARSADKRCSPEQVMAGAKTVVAVATPYPPEAPDSDARIARYALGDDYHQVLPKRLSMLRRVLYRDAAPIRVYLSTDTGPVLERAYAEQAGLGWIGKNGNLISRQFGSYLFLATLWLDIELPLDAPADEFCGTCVACLDGCPTKAIVRPGWIATERCLPYWNIEHRGEFTDRTPSLGPWLFGCDICQEVCPWNRFAQSPAINDLKARDEGPRTLSEWQAAPAEQVAQRLRESAMKRVGVDGLRRNVLKILHE